MGHKLYIITLEKIEQRYTKQWYECWKKEFSKYIDEVEYIDGKDLEQTIKTGAFLDANNTCKYKAQQVEKIADMFNEDKIKKGDMFLFADGWNFAITALKYMSQLNEISIKIFAFWHAGSWDLHDRITQVGMREWAEYVECGWLTACDGHFVATEYHKNLIYKYFGGFVKKNKIHIVGFPMDWENEFKKYNITVGKKENIVVFPHRLDKEKDPDTFDMLAKQFPKYKFIKTLDVTKGKKDYYKLLAKAKVVFSCSKQETFGIGTVEAMLLGCIPVVPDRLSYTEMYHPMFLYSDIHSVKHKIEYAINHQGDNTKRIEKVRKRNVEQLLDDSKNSYEKMAKVMLDE